MLQTELIAPVSELLERHKRERPDKVAYWDATRSVTYAQLAARTSSIAGALSEKGLREGDRIAIYLPNGVDWIEACLAGLRGGAVIVPISYDAAEAEIAYRLSDADCGLVITTPARGELIRKLTAGSDRPAFDCVRRQWRQGCRPIPRRIDARKHPTRAGPGRYRSLVLYHLHVRHDRPRQGCAAVGPWNVVDRSFVLGADSGFQRQGRRTLAASSVSFLRTQSLGALRARGRSQRTHHGTVLAAACAGAAAVRENTRCFPACPQCSIICCSARRKPASISSAIRGYAFRQARSCPRR